MSAANWTYCPKCSQEADRERAAAIERATAAYGKVPPDEYFALKIASEDAGDIEETLREDYDIGIDGNTFSVSYGASCTACGFAHSFTHSEVIPQ